MGKDSGKEGLTSYPWDCGEEFRGKDSFAFQGEESLTPFHVDFICGEG